MYRILPIILLLGVLLTLGCNSEVNNGGLQLTFQTEESAAYRALDGELVSVVIQSDSTANTSRPLSSSREGTSAGETEVTGSLDFTGSTSLARPQR